MHKLSQATTLLSAVVLITACGGGGGGTSATLAGPSTSVLATFGDGSGVARVLATFGDESGVAEIVSDGYVFVGMVPDVNSVGSGTTVATDLSGVTSHSSNNYGNLTRVRVLSVRTFSSCVKFLIQSRSKHSAATQP